MAFRKVLDPKNLPFRPPTLATVIVALANSVWHPPGWLMGILWFLIALCWIAWIVDVTTREERTLWDDKSL